MLHRVFIAINFPEDIKDRLLRFEKEYKIPAKWVGRENLHITLNFLGNLDDNQLVETIETAKRVCASRNPFRVGLKRICYGPPKKIPPRMVWVEMEESQELSKLQADLENNLFNLPSYQYKERENRSFRPHVTLARIRAFEFRALTEQPEIDEEINLSFEADSVEVMESELKRRGAEYAILESVEFSS
ncbi:MAG: RNA 2',3'-cyclic phosphodiesterase [Parcubacteria group bacterium CG08_land_8_20_14_0_20_43_9]|nr:MAG: RNA 2',3'-cyclic phosphodiesterase [Parcubacteria group bacterium CG08_land_8_20_14_0_20_43_9]